MFTHLFFDFLHLHTYSHNTDSATALLTMQGNLNWHCPSPEVSKFMNDGLCVLISSSPWCAWKDGAFDFYTCKFSWA